MKLHVFFLLVALSGVARAGSRSSASYTVAADTAGRRTTSANYTKDGSVGLTAGISTVGSPAETAKHGYVAQLFDVAGLVVSAVPPSVNESATLQLSAQQLLDDATFLTVSAASVAWGVVSGPIAGISAAGVATASTVFQNSPASVQGVFGGFTGTLNLTVLDTIADNFGAYAGDGIGDDWQVQYFGQPPNAFAGPAMDSDSDGQNNAFEFTAGLVPTDPNSVFRLRIEKVPGQPGQRNVIFSPVAPGRAYTVKANPSLLSGSFTALVNSSLSDNGQERTVTDQSATDATKLYQVEITKP